MMESKAEPCLQQSENRMHAQNAIMVYCLGTPRPKARIQAIVPQKAAYVMQREAGVLILFCTVWALAV